MKLLRLLLIPFAFIYGVVLHIRHFLYDKGVFKSFRFGKPVIVIGNLVVGGAGKSPMTEYLIRLLKTEFDLATLSRGYGRKTSGFIEVQLDSAVVDVGDEPLQFKRKFPNITVADCEDRVEGLKKMMPSHDVFILDDAFQHRALVAGLTILLFDFNSLREKKNLLPVGNYRDLFSRRNYADIIVVTKSPDRICDLKRKQVLGLLRLQKRIPVFFSFIKYGNFLSLLADQTAIFPEGTKFLVVAGIANPKPFLNQLKTIGEILRTFIYRDHYRFSMDDIEKIKKTWLMHGEHTVIVTTEKDAMRLKRPDLRPLLLTLPIYYLPIEMVFHDEQHRESFDDLVRKKLRRPSDLN